MDNMTPDAPDKPGNRLRRVMPQTTLFFIGLMLLLLAYFAAFRAGLMFLNRGSAAGAPLTLLLSALWVGLRFDLAVSCYVLVVFVVVGHLPRVGLSAGNRQRHIFSWSLLGVISALTLLLIGEFPFFGEFQMRYNQLAVQYMDQTGTVWRMIWYGYPVVRMTLAAAVAVTLFALVMRWLMRRCFNSESPRPFAHLIALAILLPLLVVGMRGGLQSTPLRWGDAYHSDNEFVNAMGLNGLFTLGLSVRDTFAMTPKTGKWNHGIGIKQARDVAQQMLLEPGQRLVDPSRRTALRKGMSSALPAVLQETGRPVNVVVVLMESFSARYCGAVGSPKGLTPRFDELAREGVLFTRALSNGTHTHQGVFATLLGFPNLPGYEAMMQSVAANQPFASLPGILKSRGYQTFFIYNGNLSWDNMRGFLRKQGVDTFIGKDDFVRPSFMDQVWGVPDIDVFRRANQEFAQAAKSGPFCGVILTLSNHTPFDLPSPLPFEDEAGWKNWSDRHKGMRYADWAIGQFMDEARSQSYFENTLFVFVGDHGYHVPPVLTSLHVLYHHVPLLFYAPKLMRTQGVLRHEIASQVDILPSVLGLTGEEGEHAAWGRNLFNNDEPNQRFVVFKASGGGKEVGIIQGNHVLVVDPDGRKTLDRISIGFPASVQAVIDPQLEETLTRQLKSYVRSGLDDLIGLRAGPPKERQ